MLDRDEDIRKRRQFHGQDPQSEASGAELTHGPGHQSDESPRRHQRDSQLYRQGRQGGSWRLKLVASKNLSNQRAPSHVVGRQHPRLVDQFCQTDFPSPRPSAVICGHRDKRLVEQRLDQKILFLDGREWHYPDQELDVARTQLMELLHRGVSMNDMSADAGMALPEAL